MWLSLRVSAFGLLICFKMSIVDQINPNILMTCSSSSCAPSARRCSLPHKFPNNLMSFPRRTQCARRRATRTGGFNRRPCQNAEKPHSAVCPHHQLLPSYQIHRPTFKPSASRQKFPCERILQDQGLFQLSEWQVYQRVTPKPKSK